MNPGSFDATTLSPTKRALIEIRELRARLGALEEAAAEPIAIVGLGCRLPGGVRDEASLWRVLSEGIDTIRDVPADRWDARAHYDADPDRPGKLWTLAGGFLDDVAGFDAAFFGIAPREAASMDPQQRLMLEVAWEALEDAAIAPDRLEGSPTGVFFGVGNNDYGRMLFASPDHIDAYAGSGGSLSIIAGRLSYVLGLRGPAMTVDTACSASLVAVHLACQSLRRGECDLALAGGVNVILTPDAHIAFTKARMMATDGRCKTFDAAADGYGRGEGAAVIVLRRLSDARAKGERVLALIRGSAVNQDGRSGGLTAPNGPAQEAVIRAALADARLKPSQVDYVEAHGTGTSLGDPIELQALAAALGEGRSVERALLVGSCKTNFGHLEAAAGITGLLKVLAALRHRSIPPHLHFNKPNPLFDWASMPLRVPTDLKAWPDGMEPARAGVSSFGFSGTNAHVILEEPPSVLPDRSVGADRPLHLLTFSARDETGLSELARRYRESFAGGAPVTDLCYTANIGRVHQAHRVSIRGASAADFEEGLSALLTEVPHPSVIRSSARGPAPVIAFLFAGQGAQYHGMARGLYENSPVFRGVIDTCAEILGESLDLVGLLYGDRYPERIDETAFAQPALFAIEVALARLWRSWGVEPAVMIGHSLGEYAVACIAGVLPMEDGLRLLVERGRLTQALPGDGAMASVLAGKDVVLDAIAALDSKLSIAAHNGPEHVVVSGARAQVAALLDRLSARGVRCRPLRVSHAFHSPLLEPALPAFAEALANVHFGTATHPLISNLHGRLAEPDELANSSYWLQQMRAPVRFEECIRAALKQGVTHFIEIGPHPVLLGMAADCVDAEANVEWLASMRRDVPDWIDLLDSLQHLYGGGTKICWRGFDRGYERRIVTAPTTPFQRRRHWIDWSASTVTTATTGEPVQVWERIAAALSRQAQQGPIGVDLSGYAEKWASLERLTVAHAATVLRTAGIYAKAGERATAGDIQRRIGASPAYLHLLERWLQRLANSNALRADGEAYVCDRPLADPALDSCVADARMHLGNDTALLDYIEHCGDLLYAVLTGKESALETLFPNGSFELAQNLYERSGSMRYFNALAAGAVDALVATRGISAPIRVLEIGAGTGSTSSSLLPVFTPQSTEYWFTDVTPVFIDRARERYNDVSFMRFAEFDLERDPAAQGFAPGSFDLIVAANAVHATRNLRESLRAIRELLAPGGTLLLIESTEHLAWFDISTGLIEGWQRFADDLRDDNPLLPPGTWLAALRDAGFDKVGAWPADGSATAELGQHLIAARLAGEAAASPSLRNEALGVDAGSNSNSINMREAALAEPWHEFTARLMQALPDERLDLLRDFVRSHVMRILRLNEAEAPGHLDRLMDLGLDSLMAVQLRNLLGAGLGLGKSLPTTLMFDHPTIESLAAYLLERIDLRAADSPGPKPIMSEVAAPTAPIDVDRLAAMTEFQVEEMLLSRLGGR
jgi:acyl transferase domain-containing protein/SAM-dependent methyltransferase